MNTPDILNRLIQLLKERNFVERCVVRLVDGSKQTVYCYGPAGALLRYNVLNEWRKFSMQDVNNENCFMVEDSISLPNRQIELPTSNLDPVLKGLRSRLVSGCLAHYINVLKQANKRLPFSIAQTGVCFRNYESNNKQWTESPFLFDASEVTDMTQLYFCSPNILLWSFNNYQRRRLHWWRQFANSPFNFKISEIKVKQAPASENSLLQSCRILYKFPWGWDTVENLVNWGDGPLKKIRRSTGELLLAKQERTIVIPAMIEASVSLERGFLALLLDSFRQKVTTKKASKNGTIVDNGDNIRCLLKLDNKLTPYKIAVTITGSKRMRETRILALYVLKEVKSCHVHVLGNVDATGSLENQFDVFDQIGVPYIIIIKESSLNTGLVDVRNRDTTIKEPVHISKIKEYILRNLSLHPKEVD